MSDLSSYLSKEVGIVISNEIIAHILWADDLPGGGGGGGGGGGYSSSSRAGRLGRTLWPQNSTSVAETEKGGQNSTMTPQC